MDNSVKQEREKEEENDLPPWEQHATVINMPRFNYHATTALLERSHSGFLITCTMKREKSATKEAIDILQKFAVGCNRRGVGWHEAGFGSSQKDQAVESTVLGRNECLHVVAGAVKEVISHSAVDLQSPEMAVLVEVLPLTRVHGSCVAAVTVLPGELVNAKPRLCVKPLVSDATVTKRKHF